MSNEIAIVGIALRVPGAATPDAFWANLRGGVESITCLGDGELARAGVAPETLADPRYVKAAGLVDGAALFDNGFFAIQPREAEAMDPQHRVFLECCWEALENAGCDPARFDGEVGAFAGSSLSTYLLERLDTGRVMVDSVDGFITLTGNDKDYLVTRLSYKLDLRGPSVSVQTACSTSLVAIHTACQSLLAGECDLALAGGVTIRVPQRRGYFYQEGGVVSPDGHCRPFDAAAAGTVFGNGAAVVALRRRADAERDGDRIRALVLGTAINNDGAAKAGFTAPSVEGQAAVIAEALEVAGVDPGTVGHVEAHGTATLLGDAVEVAALNDVYRAGTRRRGFCGLGSVKSNLGHLESAAGAVGLIKSVLALEHGELPPSLHFQDPNPQVDFTDSPFFVVDSARPWPGEGPRRAAVSSFGIGGTNSHAVLEEAPRPSTRSAVAVLARPAATDVHVLPLSSRHPDALRALAEAFHERLAVSEGSASGDSALGDSASGDSPSMESLTDLCWNAACRRAHHPYRLAVAGRDSAELAEQLGAALTAGVPEPTAPRAVERAVWVFSGQGSQWPGMGRDLLRREALARDMIGRCDALLRPLAGFSLLEEIFAPEESSRLTDTAVAQAAIFAIQAGLVEVWRAWGLEPAAVVGHSVGEVAAAWAAGVLSLEEAVQVVHHRGRLMRAAAGLGAMHATSLSPEDAEALVARSNGRLTVAALNSPSSTVLSGEIAAWEEIVPELDQRGVRHRPLAVDYAFHSAQMEPFRIELEGSLRDLAPSAAQVPIVSTVRGAPAEAEDFGAAYWGLNLRRAVRFGPAIESLATAGHDVFLEIAPHRVLAGDIDESHRHATGGARQTVVVGSMRRGEDDGLELRKALAGLYAAGASLDVEKVWGEEPRAFVELPSYPWQRQRFWAEPPSTSRRPSARRGHPLLGERTASGIHPRTWFWHAEVDRERVALNEHGDFAVVSAATWIEAALSALVQVIGGSTFELTDVRVGVALALPESGEHGVQVAVAPAVGAEADDDTLEIRVLSPPHQDGGAWCVHFEARAQVCPADVANVPTDLDALRSTGALTALDDVMTETSRQAGATRGTRVDPGRLDATLALAARGAEVAEPRLASIARLRLGVSLAPPEWAQLGGLGLAGIGSNGVRLLDNSGGTVLEAEGLRFEPSVEAEVHPAWDELSGWLYGVDWRPEALSVSATIPPASAGSGSLDPWLVFADHGGIGERAAERLTKSGAAPILVRTGDGFATVGERELRLDPVCPGDYDSLLRTVDELAPGGLSGVLHLWSLDIPRLDEISGASLCAAQDLGVVSVLHLTQALARSGRRDAPHLTLVTAGVYEAAVGASSGHGAGQAPLWGLGRVLDNEHPELRTLRVDLSPAERISDSELDSLVRELEHHGSGDIALRGAARQVARLAPLEPPEGSGIEVRSEGSYLITGGFGELGLAVARRLVERGARSLVLLGRSAPSPEAEVACEELRGAGASIHPLHVDVADGDALRAALADLRPRLAPLRGVVHAAGGVDDGLMLHLDRERFQAVMAPKLAGTLNLHRATLDDPLEIFVLFSSVVPLIGSPGQANYAAANAFLSTFAEFRRAAGHPASCIEWGPWGEIGMAARAAQRGARLGARGLEALAPQHALDAFERLLEAPVATTAVMRFDLRQWVQFYPSAARSALLSELQGNAPEAAGRGRLRAELLSEEPRRREAQAEEAVRERVASLLGVEVRSVDPGRSLGSLGLDSLNALELRNRLERECELTLSSSIMWAFPSLTEFAAFLVAELAGDDGSADTGAAQQAGAQDSSTVGGQVAGGEAEAEGGAAEADLDSLGSLAAVEDLSDEEVERLFAEQLAGLDGEGLEDQGLESQSLGNHGVDGGPLG